MFVGQIVYLFYQNAFIMLSEFKNIMQLLDFFKEDKTCVDYLVNLRWNGSPCCPHCGNEKVYVTNRGYKCADKDCHKKFSAISGTIFENTNLPLRTWYAAIYLCTAHKKGISSLQLGRDLGIPQKTAWFLAHRIREVFIDKAPELLTGTVEIDETYIGGKSAHKHKGKKTGTGTQGKTPVVGMVERGGNIKTFVIPDLSKVYLAGLIKQHIQKGITISTDEYSPYVALKINYNHITVNHSKDEFVKVTKKGKAHTQTIDGYWSLLKRGIIGIYHQISPKHLHRYCNEFSYRYNTRKLIDCNRFEQIIKRVNGKRLTYAMLIS
jgi:transposase-like protein